MEFLFRNRGGVTTEVLIIIYTGMRDPNQVFTVKNLDYLYEPESSIPRAEEGIIFLILGHFQNERVFLKISRGFSNRVRSKT